MWEICYKITKFKPVMKFDLTPSIHVHPPCYYSQKVNALFVTILTGFHYKWKKVRHHFYETMEEKKQFCFIWNALFMLPVNKNLFNYPLKPKWEMTKIPERSSWGKKPSAFISKTFLLLSSDYIVSQMPFHIRECFVLKKQNFNNVSHLKI